MNNYFSASLFTFSFEHGFVSLAAMLELHSTNMAAYKINLCRDVM
jgi:hypothetical protein